MIPAPAAGESRVGLDLPKWDLYGEYAAKVTACFLSGLYLRLADRGPHMLCFTGDRLVKVNK